MFCKSCGQQVNRTSKFCKNCGQEVKIENFEVAKFNSIKWIKEHKRWLVVVGVVFVLILLVMSFDDSSNLSKPSNFNPASSVVNILCVAKNSGVSSGGSGTIVSSDGLILTNSHIIPQVGEVLSVKDDRCIVVLPDEFTGQPKEIYYAEPEIIKGLSKEYDIALLQISAVYIDEDGESWGSFPNVFPEFNDGPDCKDEYIRLGDSVRIYGYPVTSGGYNLTITEGIVSSFSDDGTVLTSAKIDSGNSGGLAVDQYGCFIGIPAAVVEGDYQNLGVIIPPEIISEFGDKLENFDTSNDDDEYQATSNRSSQNTQPSQKPDPTTSLSTPYPAPESIRAGMPYLTGYVMVVSKPTDTGGKYVIDPTRTKIDCPSSIDPSFISMSNIKITVSNSSFSKSGYLSYCVGEGRPIYKIGGIPVGTYNLSINLPSGWKVVGYHRTGPAYNSTGPSMYITDTFSYGGDSWTHYENTNWFFIMPQ